MMARQPASPTFGPSNVPPWVPRLAPYRADVYPISTPESLPPPELRLDQTSLSDGYSARRPPYEFGSLLPFRPSPLKSHLLQENDNTIKTVTPDCLVRLVAGVRALRRAGPSGPSRVEVKKYGGAGEKKDEDGGSEGKKGLTSCRDFPLQKPTSAATLDSWMGRLASEKWSTADLAKSVPMGPAIVRAVPKVIEMMSTRKVPTQRAAWYIRVAVLNECVRQIRPDRPPPNPRVFWTTKLSSYLRGEYEVLRAGKRDNAQAMMEYVLRLARWQADEGLLNESLWIEKLVEMLQVELASKDSSQACRNFLFNAVGMFLPEFLRSPTYARKLTEIIAQFLERSIAQPQGGPGGSAQASVRSSVPSAQQANQLESTLRACLKSPFLRYSNYNPHEAPLPDSRSDLISRARDILSANPPDSDARGVERVVYPVKKSVTLALAAFHTNGSIDAILRILPANPRSAALLVCSWALKMCSTSSIAAITAASLLKALSERRNDAAGTSAGVQGRREQDFERYKFHREIWSALRSHDHEPQQAMHIARLLEYFISCSLFDLCTFVKDIASIFHQLPADVRRGGQKKELRLLSTLITYLSYLPRSDDKRTVDAVRSLRRRLKVQYPNNLSGLHLTHWISSYEGEGGKSLPRLDSNEVAATEARRIRTTEQLHRVLEIARSVRMAFTETGVKGQGKERPQLIPVIIFLTLAGCPAEAVRCVVHELSRSDQKSSDICFAAVSLEPAITAYGGSRKARETAATFRESREGLKVRDMEVLRNALLNRCGLSEALSSCGYPFTLKELLADVINPTLESLKTSGVHESVQQAVVKESTSLLARPEFDAFKEYVPAGHLVKFVSLSRIDTLDPTVLKVCTYGGVNLGMELGSDAVKRIYAPWTQCIAEGRVEEAEISFGGWLSSFCPSRLSSDLPEDGQGPVFGSELAGRFAEACKDILLSESYDTGAYLSCIVCKGVSSVVVRKDILRECVLCGVGELNGKEAVKDNADARGPSNGTGAEQWRRIQAWIAFVRSVGGTTLNEGTKEMVDPEEQKEEKVLIEVASARRRLVKIVNEALDVYWGSSVLRANDYSEIIGALKVILGNFGEDVQEGEAKEIAGILGRAASSSALSKEVHSGKSSRESGDLMENIVGVLQVLRRCLDDQKWDNAIGAFAGKFNDMTDTDEKGKRDWMGLSVRHRVALREVFGDSKVALDGGLEIVDSGIREKVTANKFDAVDNWRLLEGFGLEEDEEPAIEPEVYGIQEDAEIPESPPPVRLKRTYSAFACLIR